MRAISEKWKTLLTISLLTWLLFYLYLDESNKWDHRAAGSLGATLPILVITWLYLRKLNQLPNSEHKGRQIKAGLIALFIAAMVFSNEYFEGKDKITQSCIKDSQLDQEATQKFCSCYADEVSGEAFFGILKGRQQSAFGDQPNTSAIIKKVTESATEVAKHCAKGLTLSSSKGSE
ncbi:MAG: hypothetical protein ACAH80_14215 [Alphaproteobacteria bacterium]